MAAATHRWCTPAVFALGAACGIAATVILHERKSRRKASKRRHVGGQSRRWFLSGVMGGSRSNIVSLETDLAPQDYRSQLKQIIVQQDPSAEFVDPLEVAKAWLADVPEHLANDDTTIRAIFAEVVRLAGECDIVVSNLPEASMGSAVEIWEAKKRGKIVMTISPLAGNWLIRSVTDRNFLDLQDFKQSFFKTLRELQAHNRITPT